ncbi:MAG: hypothetical protein AB4426_11580 [Xenococcaceae cyanobacterium]
MDWAFFCLPFMCIEEHRAIAASRLLCFLRKSRGRASQDAFAGRTWEREIGMGERAIAAKM